MGSWEEDVLRGGEGAAAVEPGRTVEGGRLARPLLLRAFLEHAHGLLGVFDGPFWGTWNVPGGLRVQPSMPRSHALDLSATTAQRERISCLVAAVGGCQGLTWSSLSLCLGCFFLFSLPCLLRRLRCAGPYIVTDTLGTCVLLSWCAGDCVCSCVWGWIGVRLRVRIPPLCFCVPVEPPGPAIGSQSGGAPY